MNSADERNCLHAIECARRLAFRHETRANLFSSMSVYV